MCCVLPDYIAWALNGRYAGTVPSQGLMDMLHVQVVAHAGASSWITCGLHVAVWPVLGMGAVWHAFKSATYGNVL